MFSDVLQVEILRSFDVFLPNPILCRTSRYLTIVCGLRMLAFIINHVQMLCTINWMIMNGHDLELFKQP